MNPEPSPFAKQEAVRLMHKRGFAMQLHTSLPVGEGAVCTIIHNNEVLVDLVIGRNAVRDVTPVLLEELERLDQMTCAEAKRGAQGKAKGENRKIA